MFYWYKFLTYLFYPFTYFFLLIRKLKKKEHQVRFKEKLSKINLSRGDGFLAWFHVASVGEAMSILPLIEIFEKDSKINKILITSITLSSAQILETFLQNTKKKGIKQCFVFNIHISKGKAIGVKYIKCESFRHPEKKQCS